MPAKSKINLFFRFWFPVYAYAVAIFILSAQPAPSFVPQLLYLDKLLHLLEYALLGFLIARAAKNSSSLKLRTNFRIFAVVTAFIYGLSDELHQYFVPQRQYDILDMLVNGAGAFLGQMLFRD